MATPIKVAVVVGFVAGYATCAMKDQLWDKLSALGNVWTRRLIKTEIKLKIGDKEKGIIIEESRGRTFKNRNGLRKQVQRDKNTHESTECNMDFVDEHQYQGHLRKRNGEEKLTDDKWDNNSNYKYSRKIHLKTRREKKNTRLETDFTGKHGQISRFRSFKRDKNKSSQSYEKQHTK